jgi:hypothetical protein
LVQLIGAGQIGFKNLEDFIAKIKEVKHHSASGGTPLTTTLFKVLIKTAWVGDIFTRLELMGVTGGKLFSSPEGVADDVYNAYYYSPKVSYLRDVSFKKGS